MTMLALDAQALSERAEAALARLRERRPRVHCLTNTVVQGFTANVLLALGAVPSMTTSPEEVGDFVRGAEALLVNLGTMDAERRAATLIAVRTVQASGRPWTLDPVFVDASPARRDFALELVWHRPAVMRANAAEFRAMSGWDADQVAALAYALENRLTVAITGEADLLADGQRTLAIGNGHPLMARITGMGCAGSAVVSAFLAVEPDAFMAAAAALGVFAVAGERAALLADGPGSFAPAFLDTLHGFDAAELRAHGRLA